MLIIKLEEMITEAYRKWSEVKSHRVRNEVFYGNIAGDQSHPRLTYIEYHEIFMVGFTARAEKLKEGTDIDGG